MGKASKDGAQSLEGLAGKVTALVGAYAGLQGVKSLINMAGRSEQRKQQAFFDDREPGRNGLPKR